MHYDLAKWASNARRQANLTQEELAEAIGFSGKGSVSAIENGRNKPTFDIMLKISEVCNYPLPYQNQVIHNHAEQIQVGGNNFGEVSKIISQTKETGQYQLIDLDSLEKQVLTKIFSVKTPNNDLQEAGIFKEDILVIDPNLKAKHGNIVLVVSDYGRGLIAELSVDLKNQYFLKYNKNEPEIMPSDVKIIGVVIKLNRNYN